MDQLVAEQTMAKRNDASVKIDAEVIAEAKMVAASRDLGLSEYLSELLRPLVKRDLEQEFERRAQTKPKQASKGKSPKKM